MQKILLLVEGHGEVAAAPVLIRRLLNEKLEIYACEIEVHRRNGLCHLRARDWGRFHDYLQVAFFEECPILWILDCDDDCAFEVAREMSYQASLVHVRQAVAFALLPREYETMFLYDIGASIEALGLEPTTQRPEDPKGIRGAKGWLSRKMKGSACYKESIDQPRVSARLNLELLEQQYRDFGHLAKALRWLSEATNPEIYPIDG